MKNRLNILGREAEKKTTRENVKDTVGEKHVKRMGEVKSIMSSRVVK